MFQKTQLNVATISRRLAELACLAGAGFFLLRAQ